MESLVKSDIFFFITTLCVIAITVLVIMILCHVLHIVRIARKTVDRVHGEAEGIADDFAELRETLKKNQYGLKPILDGIKKKTAKRPARRKEPKASEV